jgi:hypothetical protein
MWPRCQLCFERLGFVGQLYASDRLPLGDLLGVQFYACDDDRKTFDGQANDQLPIHMEMLPPDAPENTKREGTRCPAQPMRYISYTPVEDPMDQRTLHRRGYDLDVPDDHHLLADKVGGLFLCDGSDAPAITRQNRLLASFTWAAIRGPIMLYRSAKRGLYMYHYR